MDYRAIRDVEFLLPGVDSEYLEVSTDLTAEAADFLLVGQELRQLDLTGYKLARGRIEGLSSEKVVGEAFSMSSLHIHDCELGMTRWSDFRLSRVVFTDCRLYGLRMERANLSNVIFERCRLDYCSLESVRCTGPVAFVDSSMMEGELKQCDFTGGLIDSCRLDQLEINGGRFQDCSLRGSDLSSVRGVGRLGGAKITRQQLLELAEALARELEMAIEDV